MTIYGNGNRLVVPGGERGAERAVDVAINGNKEGFL